MTYLKQCSGKRIRNKSSVFKPLSVAKTWKQNFVQRISRIFWSVQTFVSPFDCITFVLWWTFTWPKWDGKFFVIFWSEKGRCCRVFYKLNFSHGAECAGFIWQSTTHHKNRRQDKMGYVPESRNIDKAQLLSLLSQRLLAMSIWKQHISKRSFHNFYI